MNTTKITREEALRRWNASKETKRKMVEKLETLVRNSCLERTGKEPIGIEVWQSKHEGRYPDGNEDISQLEQKYGSRNIVSRHD